MADGELSETVVSVAWGSKEAERYVGVATVNQTSKVITMGEFIDADNFNTLEVCTRTPDAFNTPVLQERSVTTRRS